MESILFLSLQDHLLRDQSVRDNSQRVFAVSFSTFVVSVELAVDSGVTQWVLGVPSSGTAPQDHRFEIHGRHTSAATFP